LNVIEIIKDYKGYLRLKRLFRYPNKLNIDTKVSRTTLDKS
jgi:hypothetical protein